MGIAARLFKTYCVKCKRRTQHVVVNTVTEASVECKECYRKIYAYITWGDSESAEGQENENGKN